MRLRSMVCIAQILVLVMNSSCSEDPTKPNIDNQAQGEARMLLIRSASSIPSSADSLAIRIWHPHDGFNIAKFIIVPAPGDTSRVLFNLSARPGYSVGAIAYKVGSTGFEALAGGGADSVNIQSGQTTEVEITLVRWGIELSAPDSFISGEQYTVSLVITDGPIDNFLNLSSGDNALFLSTNPWTGAPSSDNRVAFASRSNDTLSFTFNAPSVVVTSRAYFQFRLAINKSGWDFYYNPFTYLPSTSLGDTLYSRHLAPSGGGTIIIIIPKTTDLYK